MKDFKKNAKKYYWVSCQCTHLDYPITAGLLSHLGFPGGSDGKETACDVGDLGSTRWEDPQRRGRLPTPVLWPRSLGGYSSYRHKESDVTERLSLFLSPLIYFSCFTTLSYKIHINTNDFFPKKCKLCPVWTGGNH